MCRLFGFRSSVPGRAHRSLLEAENAVARQSIRHTNGWGIGWYVDDDAYVVKAATAAHESERFQRASRGLTSHTMVVHVRRATVGIIDTMNAHPFRYGRWLCAHNGTIFSFDEHFKDWMLEQIDEGFRPLIMGDTDSEHLFYYLLSALADNGIARSGRLPSDAQTVGRVLRAALLALDRRAVDLGLERPILNVLLTDGRCFLAHRAGMPLHLSTQKHFCPDFGTCPEPSKVCMLARRPENTPVNHLLVASETIGEENVWEELEDGTTLVLDEAFYVYRTPPEPDWTEPELPERFRRAPTE
ncbi:MAG: putative glutamine amidotransferase [Myxococcota bacterium]